MISAARILASRNKLRWHVDERRYAFLPFALRTNRFTCVQAPSSVLRANRPTCASLALPCATHYRFEIMLLRFSSSCAALRANRFLLTTTRLTQKHPNNFHSGLHASKMLLCPPSFCALYPHKVVCAPCRVWLSKHSRLPYGAYLHFSFVNSTKISSRLAPLTSTRSTRPFFEMS